MVNPTSNSLIRCLNPAVTLCTSQNNSSSPEGRASSAWVVSLFPYCLTNTRQRARGCSRHWHTGRTVRRDGGAAGLESFIAFREAFPKNVRVAHTGRDEASPSLVSPFGLSQCQLTNKHRRACCCSPRERMSAMEEIRNRKLQPIYNALERCVL